MVWRGLVRRAMAARGIAWQSTLQANVQARIRAYAAAARLHSADCYPARLWATIEAFRQPFTSVQSFSVAPFHARVG
eukprot:935292-Lingulodinium_polyedra.AAC.1